MAERRLTLSVAQIQSLALKTMGFRSDLEVTLRAPYDDSTEVEFDLHYVRIGINHEGKWYAWALEGSDPTATTILSEGTMPKFWEWREH